MTTVIGLAPLGGAMVRRETEAVVLATGSYLVPFSLRVRFPMAIVMGLTLGVVALALTLRYVLQNRITMLAAASMVIWVAGGAGCIAGALMALKARRRYVDKVEWTDGQVTFTLQLGTRFAVDWEDIDLVRLPLSGGDPPSAGEAAVLLDSRGAFRLPLAPTPGCRSFLEASRQKARVERVQGES